VTEEAINMPQEPAREGGRTGKVMESPPLDPDPEIVGHAEGNRREIRRAKAFIRKFVADLRAEQASEAQADA